MTALIASPNTETPATETYTAAEVASICGVRPRTVHSWHSEGLMPAPVRETRPMVWARRDIDVWVEGGRAGASVGDIVRLVLRAQTRPGAGGLVRFQAGEKLVLLVVASALCEFRDTRVLLSLGDIAARAGMSVRWVKSTVRVLRESGLLIVEDRGRGLARRYGVDVDLLPEL